ncbi:hypothetical protein CS379_24165 [Methylobacterium frigidaeris]|nr:hypothetical protein CS379_24165 [Methylobacterium frigidaeris]
MSTAPQDGRTFLAGLWVNKSSARGTCGYWDAHVIRADDEHKDTVHPDFENGWEWDDYSHWCPIEPPAEGPDA